MRFGFGVLRLSSDAFWKLSPHELAAASAAYGEARGEAQGRAAFLALASAFPDGPAEPSGREPSL